MGGEKLDFGSGRRATIAEDLSPPAFFSPSNFFAI
jgi:hypothetical protein